MVRRKWNSSNPLYRWLKRKGRLKGQRKKAKRRSGGKAYSKRVYGGYTMARRKRYGRSRKSGMGIPSLKKMAVIAAAGLGAAVIASRFMPNVDSKIATGVGGFLAGGPIGAIIGYVAPGFIMGGGATNGGGTVYY